MTAARGTRTKVGDDYLTRREAAELADVHMNTIRLWESTGRLNPIKRDDGVVMVPRAEVEGIIATRVRPHSEAERIAGLEAENRELRRQLDETLARYDDLLKKMIETLEARRGEE